MNWYKKIKTAQNKDLFADNSWEEDLATFLKSHILFFRNNGDRRKKEEIYMEGYQQWIKRRVSNKYKLMDGSIDPRITAIIADFVYENFGFDPISQKTSEEANASMERHDKGEEYEIDFDENDPENGPMTWDIKVPSAQELDRQWGGEPEPPTPSVKELEDWPSLKEKPKR